MTDTKRLLVLIIVALWCLCSLPFAHAQYVTGQYLTSWPPIWEPGRTEQTCQDEPIETASTTIVIKKKGGGVPAEAPSGPSAYAGMCNATTGALSGDNADDNSGGNLIIWNNSANLSYSCPGSGTKTISYLKAYVRLTSGTPNIRVAVYNEDMDELYCQSAEVAAPGSIAWTGSITGALVGACQCTGGEVIVLAVTMDGDVTVRADSTDGNRGAYAATDYTAGFPATLPGGSSGYAYAICMGVD